MSLTLSPVLFCTQVGQRPLGVKKVHQKKGKGLESWVFQCDLYTLHPALISGPLAVGVDQKVFIGETVSFCKWWRKQNYMYVFSLSPLPPGHRLSTWRRQGHSPEILWSPSGVGSSQKWPRRPGCSQHWSFKLRDGLTSHHLDQQCTSPAPKLEAPPLTDPHPRKTPLPSQVCRL